MEKEITKVLKYFAIFAYYPTSEEIYTFLQAKISKNELNIELDYMVKLKLIKLYVRYTPPQYSIRKIKDQKSMDSTTLTIDPERKSNGSKIKNSENKLNNWRFRVYIKLISLFPQIKLVGLSGSISMMNAKEGDDIDLFIITAKNRLFTGRLITLVLAQLLGLRRKRDSKVNMKALYQKFFNGKQKTVKNLVSSLSESNKNKVCLNLFFDENNLKVPKFKQTEFVGHEVLQMKPLINKDSIYKRFLSANSWVFRLFPNASLHVIPVKTGIQTKITIFSISDKIEQILKNLQLRLINKHKTTELITNSQLWFHPDDFEKKIQSRTTS